MADAKYKISKWVRIDSKSQPMQTKSAANYSNAALARMEALNAGYDEAIMLNNKGHVAEGSAENIFVVKNGKGPRTRSDSRLALTRQQGAAKAPSIGTVPIQRRRFFSSLKKHCIHGFLPSF